jgi:hypothetical protein
MNSATLQKTLIGGVDEPILSESPTEVNTAVVPIRRRFVGFLTAGALLIPLTLAAQGLTGALIGTVKDEHGAVLAGALVRITSVALIGGPAVVTTNERGQFRFSVLSPGPYALDIELAGFTTYHGNDILIGAGATIERTATLKLAGVAESIVVEGSGSRIEARGSGFETRFKAEDFSAIPTRRFSMFDFIRAAPGVSPTSPSGGPDMTVNAAASPGGVSVFGSGTNENLFLIDGTNFTCPCSGGAAAEPGVDFIQEVQVQSVGASAEYGNIQGGVINVVTRQGSNRFLYDASYYGQPSRLTSQPVLLPVPAGSQPISGYTRVRYHDFTTNVGGPVRRDRLWFFAGYQYLRDYDSQPGTDPEFPRTYEQDNIFGKLTWQFKPGLQLMQSYHEEFWVSPDRPTLVTPFPATARHHGSVPATTFGQLTQTLSSNTLWDVRVGRFVSSRLDDPSTGDSTTPGRYDAVTGVASWAPMQIGGTTLIRTSAKATFSHYQAGLFAADQQWKVGGQVEVAEHRGAQVIPTGIRFVDINGQPSQAIARDPSVNAGEAITASGFVSDSLTVRDRITLNAGLRFDHSRAVSQDAHAWDVSGRETQQIIPGLGTLYTWNVWSPRLGVTAKLSHDGRTILRASYGRFNQGVLTGELAPIHPGTTSTTTTTFDPTTGAGTPSVLDPRIHLRLDPNTRTPRTDEYSIGLDREITRRLTATVAYVHKNGDNFIAWTDVGGQYQEKPQPLPGGESLPVFELANSKDDRRFLLTNPDGYSLTYNGLVMAVEKRRAHGWQAFGSYTLSRAYGLQAASGTTAAGAQISSVLITNTFGRDPNDLTNATGRLPNDRPHAFRVMGTVDVPHTGVVIAANLECFSGKPWAATAQIPLLQGTQRILLEPRGSRRLSSQSLLNVRVSKSIAGARWGRIELLFDVLNALNDTAEEALASDVLGSLTFGKPTVFMDPRRAMLGVRLNLRR